MRRERRAMDSLWTVQKQEFKVQLTPAGQGWTAQIGETTYEVASFTPGRLVLGDGRVFTYAAHWSQPGKSATVQHHGHTIQIERQGAQRASAQAQGSSSAPMNGQVTKILKQVGEAVEAGEVVLVLEAMKMENEVTAPNAGTLKAIDVSIGQNVNPGQRLFSVE